MTTRTVAILGALALAMGVAAGCSDDSEGTPDKGPGISDGGADTTGGACSARPLLPADSAVGDFTGVAGAQVASTPKQLNDLINGGSEKYTQKGKFVCMAWVEKYTSTTKSYTIDVRVFDQTDVQGATDAYDDTVHPDDQDITPTIGDAYRGHENAIAGTYGADMRKGKYLVRVQASSKDGKADVGAMIQAVADAIQ